MKKAIFGILVGLVSTTGAWAQDLAAVPVHGKPVWQVVQSLPNSPGSPIAVRSLSTNQIIGAVPVDHRFLSFGGNGEIVTLAFNGEIGYVPASAVGRLYPQIVEPANPPAGPDTLEELAAAYEEKVAGQASVSLKPTNSIVGKVAQTAVVGQGSIPGYPGNTMGAGTGIDPYAGQPGAALAGGGVQGVGAMAGQGGGYMGGAAAGYPPGGPGR